MSSLADALLNSVVSKDRRKQAMGQSLKAREVGHSLVCHCRPDCYHPVREIKDLLAFSESCGFPSVLRVQGFSLVADNIMHGLI